MHKSKRALRRHHRARLNRRAAKKLWWWAHDLPQQDFIRFVRRHRDNMQMCSCQGCCNERRNKWTKRWQHLTLQELRQLDSEEAQWNEIDYLSHFMYNVH